jgi:hypothetical protein
MTLAQRLARVERTLPGDWCAHLPLAVSVDGAWTMAPSVPCACGLPQLHIAVEYGADVGYVA